MATTMNIPEETQGDRLRKARRHAGLKAEDLAHHLGCSTSAITGYERDIARPDLVRMKRWADVCGVDVVWLVLGPEIASQYVRVPDSGDEPMGRDDDTEDCDQRQLAFALS